MTTKNTMYLNTYNKKRKSLILQGFGGKCQICGYNKCDSALEFHHLDPSQKELTLSKSVYSWDKTKQELKKCICVCANCHREIHEGLINLDTSKQYFDENIVSYYNPNPEKIYNECPVCGKKKLITKKYCSRHFAYSNNKKYEWNNIDLIKMIDENNVTISDIAKHIGCSWQAVKKRYNKLRKLIK